MALRSDGSEGVAGGGAEPPAADSAPPVNARLHERAIREQVAGRRVLVADDDAVQRRRLQQLLERLGFEVQTAGDGLDALEQARALPPDAIVADVLMPRLDGFELCLQVRRDERLCAVPLVLVTSNYVDEADQELAQRLGANRYVLRSLHFEAAIDALLQSLAEAPPRPPQVQLRRLNREHQQRVAWQLERQTLLNAKLSREAALHRAELCLWRNLCDAIASSDDFDAALTRMLAVALETSGIAKGALYLARRGEPRLLRTCGYDATEAARASDFFDHMQLLQDVIASEVPLAIPSPMFGGPLATAFLTRAAVSSALIVPILSAEGAVGALFLGSETSEVGYLDPLAFGQFLGVQVGRALESARAFARVAREERSFRAIVESAGAGVWAIDADSLTTYANHRLGEMLGYRAEDLIGRPAGDFVVESVEAESSAPAEDAAAAPREGALRGIDGRLLPVLMATSPLPAGAGRRPGELAVVTELTPLRQAQAEAMASDRLRSIARFASAVGHETRAALGSTIGNLEAALAELERLPSMERDGDALHELLRDARREGERVRRALRDLELFAGEGEDQRGSVDVQALLEAAARMAWNEVRSRARLVQQYARVPRVSAAESELAQLFFNLILNAAQAIEPGHPERNEIRLSTTVDSSDRVIVEISDSGCGMRPELLRRLSGPLSTTWPGTGLGLFICQRIVSRLGGQLQLESRLSRGTTARVLLPALGVPRRSGAG